MKFSILGPVTAHKNGIDIPLSGSKINTVLCALLMARGKTLSYNQLSEYLWGWTPPATMSAQIYSYVYKLRKHLGDGVRLERQHAGYTLDTLDAEFDAVTFDRRVEQGRRALAVRDYATAATQLRAGLALWRGPALTNVTDHLADLERPPLEEAWATATEQRLEADLALRQDTGLIPELTGLISQYPLREQFRAQLILALCRGGRRGDALLAFHEGRRVLADQLGVDPGPMLVQAYQEALHDEGPGFAPGPSVVVARDRRWRAASPLLPPDISHFTGRGAELAMVRGAWAAAGGPWVRTAPSRLLITGAVGTGKTALAVRIGHTSTEQFPDGVLYAPLSEWDGTPRPVTDVLVQLLHGMGEEPEPGADAHELLRRYRLAGHDRRMLVILDDVVDERRLDDLIPANPLAAAVVTSQQHLTGFPHRHVLALGPLPECDGVKLLAAVAGEHRVYREFAAARTVVRLCDGLPLALHIAGARLAAHPLWTVEHLAARLTDPARRLDELCHARQTVRGRLLAAMQRLPAPARALLPTLVSEDRAGFTAQTVTSQATPLAETANRLEELAELHLVAAAAVDDAGFTRFRLTGLNRLLATELAARAASI